MNTKTKTIAILSAALLALAAPGCRTPSGGRHALMNLAASISYNACVVGVSLDLQANPQHRAAYELVENLLSAMIERENWNSAELAMILQKLPVALMQGPNGMLVSAALASVFDAASQTWLDVQTPVAVERVAIAVRDGIRAALSAAVARKAPPSADVAPAGAKRRSI